MSRNGLVRRNRGGRVVPAVWKSNDLTTMFDDMWNRMESVFGNSLTGGDSLMNTLGKSAFPRVNLLVSESGDVTVEASVPGYAREDIEIELEGGNLVLRGRSCNEQSEDDTEPSEPKERYIFREIHKSSFVRSFSGFDPEVYDLDSISAKLDNGILTIHVCRLPVTEETQSKRKVSID